MATRDEEATARSEILLRDAEEALTQDRLREIWAQWGGTIIGMAIMLVIGTGAGVAWREWRASANQKSTAELVRVVTGGKYIMSDNFAADMTEDHQAIAWLSGARTDATPEERQQFFNRAAAAGGDSVWAWLARWNSLRVRMDNPQEDPAKLIADYETLANDKKDTALSALAYADAAVIAGERQKDPAKALEYLAAAEKLVDRNTPMGGMISDFQHLYEVRAGSAKPDDAPAEEIEEKATETE